MKQRWKKDGEKMIFELLDEYRGEEKEYKGVLRFGTPSYWENIEKEKAYNEDMFKKMLNELNGMEIQMKINDKETSVKLKVEKEDLYVFLLVMSITINRKEYLYENEKKIAKGEKNQDIIELIHIENIVEDFKQQMQNFAIAVNISYPGLLEVREIEIYVNNKKYSSLHKILSSLLISVTEARRDGWPRMSVIDIHKTWNWLNERKGFIKGMATNSIERALTALTYIYDCYSYEDLFYAMIGIESIYVSSKEGVLQQIREKSQAIFGEPADYMKRLKHMYNVRSRFIHGDLNFPTRYHQEDGTKEFEKFSDEQYFDSTNLAEAILIASIQEYVLRDTEKIEFELRIKDDKVKEGRNYQ